MPPPRLENGGDGQTHSKGHLRMPPPRHNNGGEGDDMRLGDNRKDDAKVNVQLQSGSNPSALLRQPLDEDKPVIALPPH